MSIAFRDYGDQALLLECDSIDQVLTLAAAVRDAAIPGILDVVPAYRTVLIKLAHPRYQAPARGQLARLRAEPVTPAARFGKIDVVIDVEYNGADLAEVAERTGLDIPAVVDAHTRTPWHVGFGGFAPGFAYLIGGDPRLQVPRHALPRTQVPAGSVALAGEFSGVYPRPSPGGWQLIGHTEAVLWDTERPSPALLTPGLWVQFRSV